MNTAVYKNLYIYIFFSFIGEVWTGLLISVVLWGVILWMLQKVFLILIGKHGVHFSTSLVYGWGTLLEQPPSDPSISMSGQVIS